jgi:hypothetical protein
LAICSARFFDGLKSMIGQPSVSGIVNYYGMVFVNYFS